MGQPKEERVVEIIVNGQKANASIKEMDAAVAVLNAQWRKMSQDDPGRAKLIADLNAMKAKVAEVKSEVGGVSQSAGVMKQAFANAFALFTGGGIIGVVQQIFGFLFSSREEFLQSAKSGADLEATLKSTAHAAGLTAQEIQKIGTERAKVTLFDDDETNRASAMLLTFTNIKKGVFEDAIPAIQDLATKMGGDGPADLKGASIQVGKALNDPTNGLKALTRVGVTFTEQQKDQIKAMQKAGDTAGAQKLILAELNKEFGGSAEAARQAGGGMATLSMRWNEMKETVGGFVSEGLTRLSQWLGRVLDKAQPLVDMVTELVDQFAAYYREIGDVLEGLGLFNEKTDTAAIVVEVLKTALTVLLMPLRLLLAVSRSVIDNFIEWYNKSELLRGILGGLGAVIVSLFTTIKDDALKILGGVGDIIVGIFTLDKDKIVAGFKSALSATADVALSSGQRAAEAFLKGYEANKNNKITRSVNVETTETSDGSTAASNGEAPAGESEKERKAREAALAKQHKAEEEAERHHQEMLYNLAEAALIARGSQRERELGAIEFDALRKTLSVQGSEQERAAAIALINAEAQQKKQEKQAQYDEQDLAAAKKAAEDQRKQQEEFIDQQLEEIDADETRKQAAFQVMFDAALLSQKAFDDAKYEARKAALEREMALIEDSFGKESKQYKKAYGELLKTEVDHNAENLADAKKAHKAKEAMAKEGLKTAGDVLQTTIDLLFQDEAARKKHHNLYTALAGAKIIADGVQEVAAIWQYSAEQPENVPSAGVFGAVLGGVQTALAVARTAYGLYKLQEFSFAQGGRTSGGEGMAVSPMGQLLQYAGMSVGPNGKLQDGSGFAVAGLVHEDEYVVPKWMRQDPQVVAVEQWLEAKRLRGYAEGGATGGVTLPAANAAPVTDGELTYAVQTQMLAALQTLTQQLADVKQWQSRLGIYLDLAELEAGQSERKQVQLENGIRR
ncbi:coiled-coil domain-containing protein [Hymenobacter rubidus]|uniref:hypothetical protein n=1 Tax=Hymenobacter rubidus TaxID=1441626 RepID=UPI00191FA266|nr:hypothetical protein [Hymenobacter rubidus]